MPNRSDIVSHAVEMLKKVVDAKFAQEMDKAVDEFVEWWKDAQTH